MEKRIKVIFGLFTIWFILIAITLWQMQVISYNKFTELAKSNRTRITRIPACRGRIFDRHGVLLADNKAARQLVVTASEINDSQLLADRLAGLVKLSPGYIVDKIKENIFRPFIPAVLAQDMNEQMLVLVAEAGAELPGIDIKIRPVRDYLQGEVAAHLIGYVGEVSQKDLEQGYYWDDIIGKTGLEESRDKELQGKLGFKKLQVDHRGNIDQVLGVTAPTPGNDLYLTMDTDLQYVLYQALIGRAGAGVAIDPRNGQILALVSTPGFDPNAFVSPAKQEVVNQIFTDRDRPLLNRAIAGLYPPGSVFKIIVALAALEEGTIGSKNIFYCDKEFQLGNTLFRCWAKHGWMDLSNALKKSCNEYFYQLGLKLGPEPIVTMARRFGLGKQTGIGIQGEKKGLLPTAEQLKQDWYPGDTVNLSIGHGCILVTPVQVACLTAAVANNGIYYQPQVVLSWVDEKGQRQMPLPAVGISLGVGEQSLALLKEGLFRVVNEGGGTGYSARLEEFPVAGKTGTVELKKGQKNNNICWFTGFAPYAEPEIALAVVVEEGESGGVTAAPIAREVFKEYLRQKTEVKE